MPERDCKHGLDGVRTYVKVISPIHRYGHKYYGCRIGQCETCNKSNLRFSDYFYPLHCYVCHCEMLLEADAEFDIPGYEYVQDKFVFCTNCYKMYKERVKRLRIWGMKR